MRRPRRHDGRDRWETGDMALLKRTLALLLALALLGFAGMAEQEPENALPGEVPGQDSESAAGGEESLEEKILNGAPGYVLVNAATQAGWLPLPKEGEYTFPLTQRMTDGTETTNMIHLTPEGVYMEDSTCENHDCVKQGVVTLENRNERVLGNMIICLPNQVCLELYSPEEMLEMTQEAAAGDD